MYGVNQYTEDLSSGSGAMQPGIHENVTALVEFKKLKDDSSSPLLILTFVAKDGEEIRDILWPINEQSEVENNRKQRIDLKRSIVISPTLTIPTGPLRDEHVIPRAYYLFGQKTYHICKAIIGEDAAKKVNGSSYADFAANMVKACANNNTQLRLKVILNKKDYSSIPQYGAFLENMAEVTTTKLKMGPKDKIVPTTPDTNSNSSYSPSDIPAAPEMSAPFDAPSMPDIPELNIPG